MNEQVPLLGERVTLKNPWSYNLQGKEWVLLDVNRSATKLIITVQETTTSYDETYNGLWAWLTNKPNYVVREENKKIKKFIGDIIWRTYPGFHEVEDFTEKENLRRWRAKWKHNVGG